MFTHIQIESLVPGTNALCSLETFLGATLKEKYEGLYVKIVELLSVCKAKGGDGEEWIITTPEIAAIFECTCIPLIPGQGLDRPTEVTYLGCINARWKLYADPNMDKDVLLLGKGDWDGQVPARNVVKLTLVGGLGEFH